jgi:hypothetical protein
MVAFILLEFSNILAMYFSPGSKKANAVGVFTAWEKSKQDPEVHDFVKYLVNWIAGTKLIFILLLIVIIFFADPVTQRISLVALMVATATFYWRLFPLIRKMDGQGQIEPKNYSLVLGGMIAVFIAVFLIAVLV